MLFPTGADALAGRILCVRFRLCSTSVGSSFQPLARVAFFEAVHGG